MHLTTVRFLIFSITTFSNRCKRYYACFMLALFSPDRISGISMAKGLLTSDFRVDQACSMELKIELYGPILSNR